MTIDYLFALPRRRRPLEGARQTARNGTSPAAFLALCGAVRDADWNEDERWRQSEASALVTLACGFHCRGAHRHDRARALCRRPRIEAEAGAARGDAAHGARRRLHARRPLPPAAADPRDAPRAPPPP